MGVLPPCMSCTPSMPGTLDSLTSDLPYGSESEMSPAEEQQKLLMAEPSLQY